MPEKKPARDVRAAYAISGQQARNLHLAVQGLLNPPRARATPTRLRDAIRRMRLLQIDTINVVARSPYLVLFSRVGDYELDWLNDLLKRGAIFECWAHEACFASAEDFSLHRGDLSHRAGHWADKSAQRMHRDHRAGMDRLLAHIREHGEVKASDFEAVRQGGKGWWGWKDEKRWLEALFSMGELMIARRENFQRVYDLRERVMAKLRVASSAAMPDVKHEFIVGAVRALGIAQARWIADYFRTPKKHKDADLQTFVESGELIRVDVRGWENPGYVHRDHLPLLKRARNSRLRATHTTLLSPFDPVVWDRARALAMFDFDYTLECYTPAPKRKFGYFVLPILHRGRLIGRLDAKAHRGENRFEVKTIYFEDRVDTDDDVVADVARAIKAIALWHRTTNITVRKSHPAHVAKKLRQSLKKI
ncbi:MAG: crosslink repair DNA glycosylase YcaQ family protein [Rudaea sp.]